jgi:NAD(P)-dependent dehydrogenase (short-subunit alcohol dehydrogenase family)
MDKYRSLFNLDGKVALVAGGGGDIGKAISEGLASFGATVVVCGRTLDKAQAVADGIVVAGGKASSIKLDVLDVKGVGCCVDEIVAQHGHVDILVNCVGTQIEAPAEEYKEEDWDRIFAINLKSAFFPVSRKTPNIRWWGEAYSRDISAQCAGHSPRVHWLLCQQRWHEHDGQAVGERVGQIQHLCKWHRANIYAH